MRLHWQSDMLADLERANGENSQPFHIFLDTPTMRAELFELAAGAQDTQSPHEWDELYYVAKGKAQFRVGGQTMQAVPGQFLFVKAGLEHRFFDIEVDLQVFVFFAKAKNETAKEAGK